MKAKKDSLPENPTKLGLRTEYSKRIEQQISALSSLIASFPDNLIPQELIQRCQLFSNEETSEELKFKFLTLLMREFRKNKEAYKYRI
eukprot:CAMPEP_0202974498 /NCGR_PEP_ID=MMETSP1396-20130829/60957_1 /ASSEMBLY_ACC=CAM_ASM_000872 /TAXON_ID= /ORGANISM="Pseudokeronopsis sp., Strain Brazil" /LENGTH=87 /DNA_ID=CAMNT_0049708439 /DNA_START=145 /DNA_END=408 /DNA_ORIENTATION=-